MDRPLLVSISCITYNHAPYIRQCLDGFLMQKTDFSFEVLIHDDCSTDGTTDIIKEYEAKYPHIIKPLYEEENQYQQGKPAGSAVWNYPRAKGKYIALCEGDDFWNDPLKLQRQVDFMELHPDYSLCFHAHYLLYDDNSRIEIKRFESDNYDCSISEMIVSGGGYMATNSMLFRHEHILNYPEWALQAPVADFPLMLVLFHRGKVAYLNMSSSVYRMCIVGSWSARMKNIPYIKRHFKMTDNMLKSFNRWSGSQYRWAVLKKRLKNKILKVRDILKHII